MIDRNLSCVNTMESRVSFIYSLSTQSDCFYQNKIATAHFLLFAEHIDERVQIINDYFTFSLYSNVCRSLFEKHKLHFAFLMCARILMDEGKIDGHEWHHFLAGGTPQSVQFLK
jgi:hypothetical protein